VEVRHIKHDPDLLILAISDGTAIAAQAHSGIYQRLPISRLEIRYLGANQPTLHADVKEEIVRLWVNGRSSDNSLHLDPLTILEG
jgi:hypothetical protein